MTPSDRHPVDEHVRAYLEQQASQIDATKMLARIHVASAGDALATPVSRRGWMRWAISAGAGTTIAASVGGFLFFGSPVAQALAAPEELIREAKEAHSRPADRCYTLTADWEPTILSRFKLPPLARGFRIWTRQDAFWLESQAEGVQWVMGQEVSGRIWFSDSRKRAIIYDASEIDEPLLKFCHFVSLRMVSTLAEVLEKCTLLRQDSGRRGEPVQIEATIRPNFLNRNPAFRRIRLELDPVTHVVQRAEFDRQEFGETAGRLTFTLVDTTPQLDESYRLQGHVDTDAEIFDRDSLRLERRRRFRDEFIKRVQRMK